MDAIGPSYKGFRFPVEIISHCVWLYHRFPLSFREGDDRSAEDQATQREHDARAAVLALGESVDRPDHGFQRLVNRRYIPAVGHAGIVHHRGLAEHGFLPPCLQD